jgi:hypothetical protein
VAAIATVSGTAIRPGISRNNRLYTVEAIGRMVERAQQRLDAGDMPLTTLTHHEAGDDSTRIVGHITRITQEADGSATYDAEITDTGHGRDILSLVSGPSPALKGVSIRGAWVGPVRREVGPGGVTVETADDLELDGLDYTRKPGVHGAGIESVSLAGAEPRESDGTTRVPITESAPEASVTITEADTSASGDSGPFADHSYHSEPRLPLGTRAQAKASWLALSESETARQYTSAQLKRVKQRITKALRGFGVTVAAQEGWLIEPAARVTEALAECWDMDAQSAGNLYVSLTNGPTTVTVSSYCLDPHDLDAVGRAAMAGACQAIALLDPDMDADMDVPGAPGEDTDSDGAGMGESAPAASPATAMTAAGAPAAPALAGGITQTPAPELPAAANPTMAEPETAATTAAAPATGGVHLTDDQFTLLLNRLAPAAAVPVEAAPVPAETVAEAAPAAETPAPVTETEEQRIARLVEEGIKAALPKAVQEHVEHNGPPARKGVVPQVTEHTAPTVQGLPEGAPAKPLHEYTDEEWREHIAPAVVGAVLKGRTVTPTA